MGIKGLTDRGLAFPEIGRIRKGSKKTANRPGKDLTYFRVEFGEKEHIAEKKFIAAYGDKPDRFRIILPFNDIDQMWSAWLEAYTAGRMVARSDGEYIIYQTNNEGDITIKDGFDVASGQRVPHPVDDIAGHDYKGNPVKFKDHGRLRVIVPELERAAYLMLGTTSKHDIGNIDEQLRAFHSLNNGQIAGIPFILRRSPKEISKPIDGKRVRSVSWLISIEADPEWVSKRLAVLKTSALPQSETLEIEESVTVSEPFELENADVEILDDEEEENPEEKDHSRPYSPSDVKNRVSSMVVDGTPGATVGENDYKVLAATLNTTLGDKTKRYELCQWLVGVANTKDMSPAQIKAMLKWQGISGFGEMPSDDVLAETRSCHTQALKDGGQQELI